MGFARTAKARVTQPVIGQAEWVDIRSKASLPNPSFERRQAAQVVLDQYDPGKYLLSHCTIVASVDTEDSGLPTGIQMFDGVQINRKYPDYLITVGTSKYINNNHDAWERKLLLSSFRTFVGGENYVEHIQIPELSKGKIIDAAARDIGDSVYVDILIATDRKHKPLIDAITSGQLSTLSMGCHVGFTQCTKCGNIAEDETQLCRHIKYEKGTVFLDARGQRRKVAELCGHIKAEPGSVNFIEGSWVANPAFAGAVLRAILDPQTALLADAARQKIQVAFSRPVEVFDPSSMQKAAGVAPIGKGSRAIPSDHLAYLFDGPTIGRLTAPPAFSNSVGAARVRSDRLSQIKSAEQDFPGQADMSGQKQDKAPEDGNPFKKTIDDLYSSLVEEVTQRVRKDLSKAEQDKTKELLNPNRLNESLIKSAIRYPKWRERARVVLANVPNPEIAKRILAGLILHDFGGWDAVASVRRFTGREILVMDRFLTRMTKRSSLAGDGRVYRTVIAVGGTAPYADVNAYLAACREVMGRTPTGSERAQLVDKGKLFALGL